MPFCYRCGRELPYQAKFCDACGVFVAISAKDKIAHKVLLKEIHLVDNLLETHANIMMVLISGLLFLVFKVTLHIAVYILSILGLAVSVELFCHIYRLKKIAESATDRVKEIENRMIIDTRRKPAMLWKIEIPTGSTLILCISAVFIALWLILIGLLFIGYKISLPTEAGWFLL